MLRWETLMILLMTLSQNLMKSNLCQQKILTYFIRCNLQRNLNVFYSFIITKYGTNKINILWQIHDAFCQGVRPKDRQILSQPQRLCKTTSTSTLHCSWVGHENDYANPTHLPPQKLNISLKEPHIWKFIEYNSI